MGLRPTDDSQDREAEKRNHNLIWGGTTTSSPFGSKPTVKLRRGGHVFVGRMIDVAKLREERRRPPISKTADQLQVIRQEQERSPQARAS
jgi:hypothetical protein